MSCVEATIAQFALALLQIVVRRRFTPRMSVKTSSDTVPWKSEKEPWAHFGYPSHLLEMLLVRP